MTDRDPGTTFEIVFAMQAVAVAVTDAEAADWEDQLVSYGATPSEIQYAWAMREEHQARCVQMINTIPTEGPQ